MTGIGFEDLQVFTRVAALGTLSAVARERNVRVSQISRAIQRIEKHFKISLIHRSTHGLSLTPEGEILAAHAQRIGNEVDSLDAALGHQRGIVSGLVRVSMSAIVAQYFFVEALGGLREKYPNLMLDIRVEDAVLDLSKEGIDIAIRTGSPRSDTLISRKLGHVQRRLYASPGYLAKRGEPQKPEELDDHVLIAHSRHAYLNVWSFTSGEGSNQHTQHVHVRPALSTDNSAVMAEMAVAGLGIARLSSLVEARLVGNGQLKRILSNYQPEPPSPISAYMLPGRHRLPKIRACVDHWTRWLSLHSASI